MLAVVGGAVGVAAIGHAPGTLATEAMVLLLGIVVVAVRCRPRVASFAVLLAALAFNVLFTEPRWSLAIADRSALLAFAVMLGLGLALATLVQRLRASTTAARQRADELASLNQLARAIAVADDEAVVAAALLDHLATVVDAPIVLLVRKARVVDGAPAVSTIGADWLGESSRRTVLARLEIATDFVDAEPAASAAMRGGAGPLGLLLWRRSASVSFATVVARTTTALAQAAIAIERLRAQAAERALHEAAATERLRSTLLASVSHDLRTPLASITGAASSLLDDGAELPPAERAALLAGIVQESQRLNELIANLLFATRLDAGDVALRREWTSLEEIVGAAVRRARAQASGRPIQVEPATLPLVQADPVLLEQCVFLLLDNALRHTPPGTAVQARPFVGDGRCGVDVHDDGPGVPAAVRGRLFERFARGERSSGLGLGLPIAAAIARAHGGTLELCDEAAPGATFRLQLPVPVQPRPLAPEGEAPADGDDA